MSIEKTPDIIILGGGILGFTTAYHLAKEGIISQVIEMDSIAAKASGKAGGHIPDAAGNYFYAVCSSYTEGSTDLMVPLGEESYLRFQTLHQELREETGLNILFGIRQQLECALTEKDEKLLKKIAFDAMNQNIRDVKWISGDEVRALDNRVTAEALGAAVTNCAQVEPYRYTLALAQGAERMGVEIKYARAVGFRRQRNKVTAVVLSSGREVSAGTFVIAMGPWNIEALSWLGLKLPMVACRAHMLKLVAPRYPDYIISFRPPLINEWPHVYSIVSPRFDDNMYVGYTEDRTESWDDNRPETWVDFPSMEMQTIMLGNALRLYPALEDASLVEHRAAVLGFPRQWMITGPVPDWDNVYMTMLGDNGIAVSPSVGRIMTNLIIGGERRGKTLKEIESISPVKFLV